MSPQLAIITGLSGAGRTTAAKVLEDLDYFVIDNLPAMLISRVVDLATAQGSTVPRVALVVDVRGRHFFGDLQAIIKDLHNRGLDPRVLFLEASDDALVARYEAARRAHPLAGSDRVIDGISRERELLADLRAEADLVIDTTDVNVHELRDRLVDVFAGGAPSELVTNIVSFGFKHGTPRDADIILDVRFLPNPHWVDSLRPFSGLDDEVKRYVMEKDQARAFVERVRELLDLLLPSFVEEGRHYLTIAVGCTGGRHRSVVMANEISSFVKDRELPVAVVHRDIDRSPVAR